MSDEHAHGAHEKSDLNYRPMMWVIPISLIILVVFTAVVVFLSAGAASGEMEAKQYQGADAGRGQVTALRAHEDSVLAGLAKDSTGRAGIPVERAMEILAGEKTAPENR
jgi:hypothetical protein